MTPDQFLAGTSLGRAVFEAVTGVLAPYRDVEIKTTKSQIAFKRRRGFAYIWLPGLYLANPHAEVVLSIALDREIESPRWKEVANPSPSIWQHHLEITDLADIDDEIRGWLREAYAGAA